MKMVKKFWTILLSVFLLSSSVSPSILYAIEEPQEEEQITEVTEETEIETGGEAESFDEPVVLEESIEEPVEDTVVVEEETTEKPIEEPKEEPIDQPTETEEIPTQEETPTVPEETPEVVEKPTPTPTEETVQEAIINNRVEYISLPIDDIELDAVVAEGNEPVEQTIAKLENEYELSEEDVEEIRKHLFDDIQEGQPLADKDAEKDGIKITGLSAKWADVEEETITLFENNNSVILQVNYALSGKQNFGIGDVIISLPDYLIKDETGNGIGEVILPYDEELNEEKAFNWKHEGGFFILSNTRELNANTIGYFQVLIKNISTDMAVLTVPFEGTLEVVVDEDVIGTKTNELILQIDKEEPQEEKEEESIVVDLLDGELLPEEAVEIITEEPEEELLVSKNLSFATKRLLAGPLKAAPQPQTPVTADHITIEKVTIRWVSASSGSEESAMYDDLELVPTNDIVPNQQWQLDVAFSGKDEIKAGDIEIVIPAYIWKDRDGNEPGILTVAVPREGEPGAGYDFAWKRVGDNIVITNTKNLSAASKYMIQGTFRMTSPDPNSDPQDFTSTYAHQMVDGKNGITDYISNDLFGVINVTTPNTGETISMTSNVIKATIDTHVEVANASKTAYDKYKKKYNVYYHADRADIPSELLPENPDDYLYIKWYVDGRAIGNQPFTMTTTDVVQDKIYKVEGTTEIEIPAEGIMLGATDDKGNAVKSTDGKSVTWSLFEGFSEDDKAGYVWTAYKKSYFEGEDATFKIYNSHDVTVKGIDDQVETSMSASASVAIRLPIVWTIKKEWLYNEDKYDTPLEVIQSRQPETLKVWLDNKSTGQTKVFNTLLSDENDWQVQFEDDGTVSNYDAFEHSYEVTRHMHGEDGTSVDIVTGKDDVVYTDDGRWYYKYWGYDHKSTVYDEETHTWTFVNDYHEGIIGGGYDDFEVAKEATNHTDQNQKSVADKDLNLLQNGQNSTSINYDVHTGTFCLGHTSEPGAYSWETDKHGKRYVTLELHDYGEYFESRKLRNDEFRMATVTMQLPEIYTWVPEEEGSENGFWSSSDPVPVSLYARGGDETEWTLYAVMNVDESITTYNGATADGKTVNLPEGMNETMETIRTNGARASLDYNVGVILFPSEDIQEKIEEIFESTDYAKATSFNYVTGRLLDDDKNVLGELERYDRTYLHGRVLRLAVDLDKNTEFVENDRVTKQLTFNNKITLNQQSNITSLSDYHEYFDDYLIPGSKSGTFYDLLPEGMTADVATVSVENGTAKMVDVFDDYKGTGRQLLVVKVDIDENLVERNYRTRDEKRNDDTYPNVTSIDSADVLYGTKATLKFQSLYSYDEAKNRGISNLRNTAAYEADEDVFGNVDKWSGEKDAPTGENHKESLTEVEDYLRDAMTNLDSERDNPNVVYAGSTYRITEADFDGLSSLRKYVQAAGDEEWVDGLDNSVYVYEGGKYNYRIVLTSDTDTITKDIILLDSIEYYTPMEIIEPGDSAFNAGQIVSKRELDHRNELIVAEGGTPATAKEVWYWKGYFKSIDVSEIEGMGVDVKVYYSTVPDLDITHDAYNPEHTKEAIPEKLADPTVWSTELPADPSTVTAVALDCRKAKDGSDFELKSQEALIFYMHMQAPTYEQQPEAYGEEGYNDPMNNGWAYNNVYMDITQIDDQAMAQETHSYDHYDYTKVGIWALDVEVQKEWDDKNDNDRVRPDSIDVHLIREGVDTGRSLTLDESNDWYGKFPHVLMYDEDGNRIYYTLNENPVDEYNSKVVYDGQNMTLINSRETEKVSIPFMKKWESEEPDGWQENIPSAIKVKLYADGVFTGETKTIRADVNGNWAGVFTNVDKYKDGVEIVYTIEEDVPQDFICEIDQEEKIITNTYYPYGDLSVTKAVVNATERALENTFTYTLTLKDGDGESVPEQFDYVITDKDGNEKESGKIGNGGTFTLQDQDKIVVKNIYSGVKYEVKEEPKPGFTITGQVATQGTIRSDKESEASFENTYHSYGSASFEAAKTLEGKELERFQFRFEILDSDGNTVRIASNDKNGKASFGAINYTEADDGKVYVYTVKEVDRGRGGYIYDDTLYTAEVHPVDNGDGTMTCTVIYMKGREVVDTFAFTNEYHAEGELEFKAWKALSQRELAENEFTFVLKDNEGNEVGRAKNNADGSITFDPIHFDENDAGKEYDFYMTELVEGDGTVNYSSEQYQFHVVVTDNEDGTLSFTQEVKEQTKQLKILSGEEAKEKMQQRGDDWYGFSGEIGRDPNPLNPEGSAYVPIYVKDSSHLLDKNFIFNILQENAELLPIAGDDYQINLCATALEEWGDHIFVRDSYYTPNAIIFIIVSEEYQGYIYDVETITSDEMVVPVFTNTLKTGDLKLTKYARGGDPDQLFKFRVVLEGENLDQDFPYEFIQEEKKYITLTYIGNGGYFHDNDQITEATQIYKRQDDGSYVLDDEDVDDPTRPGYLFKGWYLEPECKTKWDESTLTDDTTVYAKWVPEQVTVTFHTNGGTTIRPKTIEGGTAVEKPTDPSYGSRAFLGWYTDEELTQEYDFSLPVEQDLDLYAKWERKATISQSKWSPSEYGYSYGRLPATYRDPSVTKFKRNTTLTKDEVIALAAEKVDDGYTECSIYRWVSGDTWYWWSDADNVYMGEVLDNLFADANVEEIDLSEFIIGRVKTSVATFARNSNLKKIDFGNNILKFNHELNGLRQMFQFCTSLEELDLSGFDTRNAYNMNYMFANCSNLSRIYVSDLWSVETASTSEMFRGCVNLPTYSPDWTDGTYAHYGPGGYLIYKAAPTSAIVGSSKHYAAVKHLKVDILGGRIHHLDGDQAGNASPVTKVEDGVYEVELKSDESFLLKQLPAGTSYKIYEETPDGWVLISKVNDNGVIEPLETAHAEFENEYRLGTTAVQFTGLKHLDGEPGEGFTFVLKEDGNELQTVTSDNGMIQFDQIIYEEAGTHVYTIEELSGDDETVEYDSHVETITVEVKDNGDGTLTKTVTYDQDEIVFENNTSHEYLVGDLTINKVAETTDVNKDDTFTFQILFTGANGIPYTEDITYTVAGNTKTEAPTSGTLTITGIKAGDVVSFAELPKDTKYTISEINMPRGWSLQEASGTDGTIAANEEQTATFTNTYKASGSVRLEAHKKLEGGTPSKGDYTFELQDEEGNQLDLVNNDTLDTNKVSLGDNDETVENPWYLTAPVVFDPIEYTQDDIGKTFTYKIIETVGSDSSIEYDRHEETVTVTVMDNGEGYIKTEVTYDDDEALFVNKVKTGELRLKKVISHYTKTAEDAEFTFTIELKDAEGNALDDSYPYTKTAGETEEEGTIQSGETLTLKGNESIVIHELPNGATYSLTEEDVPGWSLSDSKNAEGTIQVDQMVEAEFTNVYTTEGSVQFEATKKLIGADIMPDTYEFIVKDLNGEIVDYGFAQEDGTIVFNGIDYTHEDDGETYYYYISEVPGNEPHIAYDNSTKEVKVNVHDNGQGELICDVTYDETGMEFVNEVGYTLRVEKQVTGEKADPDRKFNFTLTLDNLGHHDITFQKMEGDRRTTSGTITSDQLPYTFTLTADDSITFDRIPDGTNYEVTEDEDLYYTADEISKAGTIVSGNAEALFVNEINWFEVSFLKVNNEDTPISGAQMAIYQEDECIETWESTEEAYTTKLLPGDYVLKEERVSDEEMYLLAADIPFTVNVSGTVTYDSEEREKALVTMVDDYVKIEIPVQKEWVRDRESMRPTSITVKLLADGEEVDSQEINAEGDWSYTFSDLPKFKAEEEIVYTIEEVIVDGYETSVEGDAENGFVITNTAIPEDVEVEIAKIDGFGYDIYAAEIEIRDEEGNLVDSWVTDGSHYTTTVQVGKTYTFTETTPPIGYAVVSEFTFQVDEDGTVKLVSTSTTGEVEVRDNVIYVLDERDLQDAGPVAIYKVGGNGNPLKGASFKLTDINNNVMDEWTSDGEARTIFLIPGSYTLEEVSAPSGYQAITTITFDVVTTGGKVKLVEIGKNTVRAENNEITITNTLDTEPKPTPCPSRVTTNKVPTPYTGDDFHVWTYILLMVGALLASAFSARSLKLNRR